MRYKNYLYVWCLMADDGFYCEPDVSLIKISFRKSDLLDYIHKNTSKHRYYFILKKRVYLLI